MTHSVAHPASRSSPSVRALTAQDWPAVEAILHSSPEAAQWTADSFLHANPDIDRTWVVEHEGCVLGFLTARRLSEEAEILNLAITPGSRRMGLATLLVENVLSYLCACGTKAVHLEVRESNSAALSFYQRQGFAGSAVRPGYYRDPAEAAVCMVKKLRD